MKITAYKWKPGARVKVDAEQAATVFHEIQQKYGRIENRLVVKEARKKSSPLHSEFEWDINKAAMAHWEDRAKYIRTHIAAVYVSEEGEERTVSAFVCIHEDNEESSSSYDIVTAMSDEEKRLKLFKQAVSELNTWKNRYQEFEEFSLVFRAIEKVAMV